MEIALGLARVLGANLDGSSVGFLTKRRGVLTADFFTNILDIATEWTPASSDEELFNGRGRATGQSEWTVSRVDLAFGSNSQLHALCDVCERSDAKVKFVHDFVAAWTKVMNLDMVDLAETKCGGALPSGCCSQQPVR